MKLQTALTCNKLGLVDMREELKQLTYALLTKEHVLIEGEPGTGKSMLARRAFASFKGAKTFRINLTEGTTEDDLFGPIDISKLRKKNSECIRNTEGSILDADLVFLDEIFVGRPQLLNTLLSVLNEREWQRGKQIEKAKLHTAVATSNYLISEIQTKAMLDRFVFKAKVKDEMSRTNTLKMYDFFLTEKDGRFIISDNKKVDFEELQKMSDKVCNGNSIAIPKAVRSIYYDLISEFRKESKKYISERTQNKGLKIIKASALLDSRKKADFDDLKATRFMFCTLNNKDEEQLFDASFAKAIAIVKIQEELKESKKLADDIINEDIDKLSIGEIVKLIKGSKAISVKLENIANSGSLPTSYSSKLKMVSNSLERKIESMKSELKVAREELEK